MRVALVTCAALPDLDPDDRLLAAELAVAGLAVEPAVWDDPGVDWAAYDLAVLRSTWDYATRRDEFVAWAAEVPRLANPAEVVAWNTDKRYLDQLAGAGVPTVPTRWLQPGDGVHLPTDGTWVVKPAVGAGSLDAGRYDLVDAGQRRQAQDHIARLQASARLVMLQPYLSAVDTHGETSLLFLGGRYSHAIRKGPMLTGPDAGAEGLFRAEEISVREPDAAESALGSQVLAALPFAALLYARVDLLPGPDGVPVLVEIELTEPSLYLGTAPGAAKRLADAVVTWIRRGV
jgi:hypothetical protein